MNHASRAVRVIAIVFALALVFTELFAPVVAYAAESSLLPLSIGSATIPSADYYGSIPLSVPVRYGNSGKIGGVLSQFSLSMVMDESSMSVFSLSGQAVPFLHINSSSFTDGDADDDAVFDFGRIPVSGTAVAGYHPIKFNAQYGTGTDFASTELVVYVHIEKGYTPPASYSPPPIPTPMPTLSPPPTPAAGSKDLVLDDLPLSRDSSSGYVNIRVPLKYKGLPARAGGLGFLEIFPVIDETAVKIFDLSSTNPLKTLIDMEQTTETGSAVDYITFPMRISDQAENGYYAVTFHARYLHIGEHQALVTPVETDLTLYISIGNGLSPTPTPTPTPTPAGPQSVPKIIVEGFQTDPQHIIAGSEFNLSLKLHNTSEKRKVSNIKCTIDGGEAVVPVSGSNTFYIKEIGADGVYETDLHMFAQPNASPKPHPISVKMEYEYVADTLLNAVSEEQFTVTVKQPTKLVLDEPRVDPPSVMMGDMFNVYMNMFNMGKATLYNVAVTVEGPQMHPDETFYAGTMGPGETRTYDMMVTYGGMSDYLPAFGRGGGSPVFRSSGGATSVTIMRTDDSAEMAAVAIPMPAPMPDVKEGGGYGGGGGFTGEGDAEGAEQLSGPVECDIVVTYEDEMGAVTEMRMPFMMTLIAVETGESAFPPDMTFDENGNPVFAGGMPDEPMPTGIPRNALILIAAAGSLIIVIAVVVIILVVRRRRRRRDAME